MTFSVVIINYRTLDYSRNCLKSLLSLNSHQEYEIILVDNFSNDGSLEILKTEFQGRIKILESKKNLGFSGASNLGAKTAQGEFILFLNSDTIINDDIFQSAKKIFTENKKIALISPLLLTDNGEKQANAFGSWPKIKNLVLRKKSNNVDWLSGCALFIRNELFQQLLGFDEKFFLYFEDIDLCRRAFNLGYKVMIDETSRVIHLGGASIKENRIRKKHYYASQDYYFKKHYGKTKQIIMSLIRFPLKLWKMR